MNGDEEPAGTTILEASESETIYRIKNFEDEVSIPESFTSYLREMGGIDQMVNMGILNEKVANIVAKRLRQTDAGHTTSLLPDSESSGYEDNDFISSLTGLGIPIKDAETLLSFIPKNLTLQEATKLALQKYSEIVAQQRSMKSE